MDRAIEEDISISIRLENKAPDNLCKPVTSRGIYWNWTRAEEEAVRPCPQGFSGLAKFSCSFGGRWSDFGPNFSSCKSVAVSALEDKVRKLDSENGIISRLAHVTKSNKPFYGGDIDGSIAIIRTITNRLQYLFQTASEPIYNRKSYIHQTFQDMLRAISNLLGSDKFKSWMELPDDRRMNLITNLLVALDENAFLLADVIDVPEILEEAASNIGNLLFTLLHTLKNNAGSICKVSFAKT